MGWYAFCPAWGEEPRPVFLRKTGENLSSFSSIVKKSEQSVLAAPNNDNNNNTDDYNYFIKPLLQCYIHFYKSLIKFQVLIGA